MKKTKKQIREEAKLLMDKLAIPMNIVVDKQMEIWHASKNPFEAWAFYSSRRSRLQRARVTRPWIAQKEIYDANAPAKKLEIE